MKLLVPSEENGTLVDINILDEKIAITKSWWVDFLPRYIAKVWVENPYREEQIPGINGYAQMIHFRPFSTINILT